MNGDYFALINEIELGNIQKNHLVEVAVTALRVIEQAYEDDSDYVVYRAIEEWGLDDLVKKIENS